MRTLVTLAVAALGCSLCLTACEVAPSPVQPEPSPVPTPAPTPTPLQGTVRLISLSVPPGSTLVAQPMGLQGQQVPELTGRVGITLTRDVPGGRFELLLMDGGKACLGTGLVALDFPANVELQRSTFNVSREGNSNPAAVCPLPYTTTTIEVRVFDGTGLELLRAPFAVTYHFVSP